MSALNANGTRKRVMVLTGGWSAEREISLISGQGVAGALAERGYHVTTFDPPCDLAAITEGLSPLPDVVFNALHGTGGEDGTIQAILDLLGVSYTHSGMRASAVAMDKPLTKRVVGTVGVPSPTGLIVSAAAIGEAHPIVPPYVVKPIAEGSSVGVMVVREGASQPAAVQAWDADEQLLVEPYIKGRELTVGVMSRPGESARALAVTEITYSADIFDYTVKYSEGYATHILPAEIPESVYSAAMEYARLAHEVIGCTGVTRSDFRWDDSISDTQGLFFLEINTQPGMTPTSLVPEQAQHAGMSYADLVEWIVEGATCRH
ncbi:MAG: D-alanine--D-alanine ligase [Rhodospirillales bacterium]|nr:D-alanine--D-alanine ligase [Rhodospirillales bacterium]